MGLIDTIRPTLRGVVSSSSGLGESWFYRVITSAPTQQTNPQWGQWVTVDAVISGQHVAEIPDAKTGRLIQRSRQFFRITNAIALPNGSQVSKDKATIWAVDEITSSAGGTTKYLIGRDVTERAQSNRGGGP